MKKEELTYQKIKEFIEGEEGNGCKLLTKEDEFYENKCINKKVSSKIILSIKCNCNSDNNIFYTSYNDFKSGRRRHCSNCTDRAKIKKRIEKIALLQDINKLKVCNRCNCELPETDTYFRLKKNKKGVYKSYGICRQCELELRFKNKSNILANRDDYKNCKICNRQFPSTTEYFRSQPSNKDGLDVVCKECRGFSFKKDDYIKCHKCKKEYPATEEYFNKKDNGRYQLDTLCINCKKEISQTEEHKLKAKEYRMKPEVKEKMKTYKSTKEYKDKKRIWDKLYRKTLDGKLRHQLEGEVRRMKKLNLKHTLTLEQWKFCIEYFTDNEGRYYCAYCKQKIDFPQIEHFIPVSKNGGLTAENILPICKNCNARKNHKDFYKWFEKQSFYNVETINCINTYFQIVKEN